MFENNFFQIYNLNLQYNSVIMNSSGPAIFVRYYRGLFCYNRVNMCTEMTNLTLKSVNYKQVFINNEFILIEFHCTGGPRYLR